MGPGIRDWGNWNWAVFQRGQLATPLFYPFLFYRTGNWKPVYSTISWDAPLH